jgi:hypothetical protein
VSADPEADYYQTVEEYFVARRGESLFLSNAEWNLVRKWRLAGLPLRVVLRGVRDALDAHAHGWNRAQKVRSLAYCANEVEAAAERWRRALALGDSAAEAGAALRGFARELREAKPLGPRARALADALAPELEAMAASPLAEVTPWLALQEQRLVEALAADAGPERTRELEAEVDASLARWRERMPAAVLASLRRESLARRQLEAHGLPRLSLFHLEAGGAAEGESP